MFFAPPNFCSTNGVLQDEQQDSIPASHRQAENTSQSRYYRIARRSLHQFHLDIPYVPASNTTMSMSSFIHECYSAGIKKTL